MHKQMRVLPQEVGTLHFIGIGGIGMSGIAEILHQLGYCVQGSDLSDKGNVERLKAKGIPVFKGHDEAHLTNKDGEKVSVIVRSSAVKDDNPELIAGRSLRLPVMRRAEMLAELMRLKKSVVVGGTHGKTTTTSLVGAMLEEGSFDPTVVNGGIVNKYGTNTRLGESEWMVVEADESDGTFTRLPATIAVVTNIDAEHMEEYGSFDNVRKAYKRFIENLPFYGYAVLCSDHPEVKALIPDLSDRRIITYGFNPQADVRAKNVKTVGNRSTFDVSFSGWIKDDEGVIITGVNLPMIGEHNIQNALSALAIGYEMGMTVPHMKKALAHFGGVKRRFTQTAEIDGVQFIDDYGHHPVEIEAVLNAARMSVKDGGGKIYAVMQPHRYSRLEDLFSEFASCFDNADDVYISPVYAAGEAPIRDINHTTLAAAVKDYGHRSVQSVDDLSSLPSILVEKIKEGDFVIFLGAGDITKWAYSIPEGIQKLKQDCEAQVA